MNISVNAFAVDINPAITKAETFLSWLNENKTYFATCTPKKNKETIELCDGTRIETALAKKLFKMNSTTLIQFIKNKKIKLEILCQKKRKEETFKKWCKPNVNNSFFKEVSALHGQYIPYSNTIALHSDAYIGSLVHEFFHYLQYKNSNKILGHIYKNERIAIQAELIAVFDQLIAENQILRPPLKSGEVSAVQMRVDEAKKSIEKAQKLSDVLQKFGYWQKLIDERNLFLTFIQFGSELGIAPDDVELAHKNMKFLCRDSEFKSLFPSTECVD